MRVVAGSLRGRRLIVPPGSTLRPTADRTREAIFNILEGGRFSTGGASPLPGARVLDSYCGTGALGIEALSRGADKLTLVDNDPSHLEWARQNLDALDLIATLVRADARRPGPPPVAHDVVFLDPPYAEPDWPDALRALMEQGWIEPGALGVIEQGARQTRVAPPEQCQLLDERTYGAARVLFVRFPER